VQKWINYGLGLVLGLSRLVVGQMGPIESGKPIGHGALIRHVRKIRLANVFSVLEFIVHLGKFALCVCFVYSARCHRESFPGVCNLI